MALVSLRDVERLGRGRLHAGGQFVAGDAGFEVGFARMTLEMPLVEPGQKVEIFALQVSFEMRRRIEIQNPRLLARMTVAWNRGVIQPFDQLRTPSTGTPPGSGIATYAGRFWLSEPSP